MNTVDYVAKNKEILQNGSVAKNSKKYVNLEIMNKSQKIRGKHTNIIKLY
jgi:hypothetical protein